MNNCKRVCCLLLTVNCLLFTEIAQAREHFRRRIEIQEREREPVTCNLELETLTQKLLNDLPNYANRIIQQVRRLDAPGDNYNYVLLAGREEFDPLSLGPGRYTPIAEDRKVEPPQQVFFTTLERHYIANKAVRVQNYHWLFLVETESGWRMVTLFSRYGSEGKNDLVSPPRETSNGAVGQGINIWLRDCRAGVFERVTPESVQK